MLSIYCVCLNANIYRKILIKTLYVLIPLILMTSAFLIFYSSGRDVSDDEMLINKERITELGNIVECLSDHNHKTYFYIAPHKIDFKSELINDEVHDMYDDRIAKANCSLRN
ncbi:uncharacterized protein METZ01_LOCUS268303, partial [marine metagenome]